MNDDLTYKSQPIDIFSSDAPSVDIRVSSDGEHLWYAFESMHIDSEEETCNGFAHLAKYDISYPFTLLKIKLEIARGCPTTVRGFENPQANMPENPEAVDDPTPLFYNNKYVILTRAWMGGNLEHIRTFDSNFEKLEDFTLDISSISDGTSLSQNTLIDIDNQVYLIGGLYDGPPMGGYNSDIYAIPLTDDLHSAKGIKIPLVESSERYYTRVTASSYKDEKLYINYVNACKDKNECDRIHYLGVFDVHNSFQSLENIEYNFETIDNSEPSAHSSMAVMGDKVFVFYATKDGEILVNIYEWKN